MKFYHVSEKKMMSCEYIKLLRMISRYARLFKLKVYVLCVYQNPEAIDDGSQYLNPIGGEGKEIVEAKNVGDAPTSEVYQR